MSIYRVFLACLFRAWVIFGLSLVSVVRAETPYAYPGLGSNDRIVRGGPNVAMQANPVSESSRTGFGIKLAYEYVINPNYFIGFCFSQMTFPGGGVSMNQIFYGLVMRHILFTDEDSFVRPYFGYGLLLRETSFSNRSGSGVAHDTRLTLGSDWNFNPRFGMFSEISYHVSRLHFFEIESLSLNQWAVTLGPAYKW